MQELSRRTKLRVSFSLTTDDERVRALYEPFCESLGRRLEAIRALRQAGIEVFATLAPLLPCNPEALASAALDATTPALICDPLHVRSVKTLGATTRTQAWRIAEKQGHTEWFDPAFQHTILMRIRQVAESRGRQSAAGMEAFAWLAKT